mmetsp:Transcript_30037/g.64108  ORF Transcript_30037/g.64108 Transcript_30037/m.64108 type:complete len:552 (+) Transcript_30037:87-1742(+)
MLRPPIAFADHSDGRSVGQSAAKWEDLVGVSVVVLDDVFVRLFLEDLGTSLSVAEEEVGLLDVVLLHFRAVLGRGDHLRRRQQLHRVSQARLIAQVTQEAEGTFLDLNLLDLRPQGQDLNNFLRGVGQRSDDHEPVQEIHWDAVRGGHVGAANVAHASVGGKDDDRGQGGLQRAVQVGEALDVEHVDLVDEKHPGNELRHALVDVPVDDLVDLDPKLFRDFRLLLLHHLAHHGHDVLTPLRPRVRRVQVVQRDVLDDLLLLVDIALWQRHVLLRLQVEFRRVRVAPPDSLHAATVGFNVNHVAHLHFLLEDAVVDGGIQLELLGALDGLQAHHHEVQHLAVPARRTLLWRDLRDLALIHFFVLLNSESDGAPEVFHEDFSLLDLGGVDLGSDHGAEGDFRPELARDAEGKSRLACARGARQQQRPTRHLLRADHVHHQPARLARLVLAHEPARHRVRDRLAVLTKAEALDVSVRGDPLAPRGAFHFLNSHGCFSLSPWPLPLSLSLCQVLLLVSQNRGHSIAVPLSLSLSVCLSLAGHAMTWRDVTWSVVA